MPGADARIFPGDVLGVIGTDEEIQHLIPVIENQKDNADDVATGDIKLTSIQLGETSPLVGKNSRTSNLRDTYQALLVKIQRGDEFLQPDGTTDFAPHDILWLVGNPRVLSALK